MNAYTISKLAEDAGVSVHIIRDYELRGLLRPCQCTDSGYRIYDEQVLQRLHFILAGKEAGIALAELACLCQAMDANDPKKLQQSIGQIHELLDQKKGMQKAFRRQLGKLIPPKAGA